MLVGASHYSNTHPNHSGPIVASGTPTRRGPHWAIYPAGLPASGFPCISTHRVSIRPSHPSLDAVSRLAPTSRRVLPVQTPQSTCRPLPVRGPLSSVSHECPHGLIVRHRWHPRLLAAPDCSAITAFLGIGCPSLADSCFHANPPPTVYQPVGARPKRPLLKTPQSLVLPTPGTVDSFFFVFLPALHTKPCRATPSTAPRAAMATHSHSQQHRHMHARAPTTAACSINRHHHHHPTSRGVLGGHCLLLAYISGDDRGNA